MVAILPYGVDSQVQLDLPDDVILAECGSPRGQPVVDVRAAVGEALADPLDYPPLPRSMTPSDRVVVALDHGVPQAPAIVARVVREIADCGVDLAGVTVLHARSEADAGMPDPSAEVPEEIRLQIRKASHDPEDRNALAYLAASDEGEPILLNRAITDADLVLPISCVSNRLSAEYHGVHGAVYPTFADQKTLLRFHSPNVLGGHGAEKKRLVKQCNQVGWLLGLTFTIQIVPGAGDQILHVLAGQPDAVRRRGRELYQAAWGCSVPSRASLVVAAIEGEAQQTWQNVGQAIATAASLVEEGGAIVLCCDLAAHPGPAVQELAGARSQEDAMRNIRRRRAEDAIAATQLANALQRVHVYLLSRLDQSLVENLNIAPLDDPEDVVRLAQRHTSCILLSNAPHALVTMDGGS